MEMTEREIKYSYEHAKYPSKQISILAQINQCNRNDIIAILNLSLEDQLDEIERQIMKHQKAIQKLEKQYIDVVQDLKEREMKCQK